MTNLEVLKLEAHSSLDLFGCASVNFAHIEALIAHVYTAAIEDAKEALPKSNKTMTGEESFYVLRALLALEALIPNVEKV